MGGVSQHQQARHNYMSVGRTHSTFHFLDTAKVLEKTSRSGQNEEKISCGLEDSVEL
jgi:hypothetical protein